MRREVSYAQFLELVLNLPKGRPENQKVQCERSLSRLFFLFKSIQLRLPRLMTHFGWLAADSLGFCDQSTHFTEEYSSAVWVCRGL